MNTTTEKTPWVIIDGDDHIESDTVEVFDFTILREWHDFFTTVEDVLEVKQRLIDCNDPDLQRWIDDCDKIIEEIKRDELDELEQQRMDAVEKRILEEGR